MSDGKLLQIFLSIRHFSEFYDRITARWWQFFYLNKFPIISRDLRSLGRLSRWRLNILHMKFMKRDILNRIFPVPDMFNIPYPSTSFDTPLKDTLPIFLHRSKWSIFLGGNFGARIHISVLSFPIFSCCISAWTLTDNSPDSSI